MAGLMLLSSWLGAAWMQPREECGLRVPAGRGLELHVDVLGRWDDVSGAQCLMREQAGQKICKKAKQLRKQMRTPASSGTCFVFTHGHGWPSLL